jgi:hypothetical protein
MRIVEHLNNLADVLRASDRRHIRLNTLKSSCTVYVVCVGAKLTSPPTVQLRLVQRMEGKVSRGVSFCLLFSFAGNLHCSSLSIRGGRAW